MSAIDLVFGCLMVLLILFLTISCRARYYMKFTVFIVVCLISATLGLPFMLLRPFSPKNALFSAAALRVYSNIIGIRWQVRGIENIDNSHGNVVLLNHQSGLDLIVLGHLWPLMDKATVIAKRSLQYLVPFGTATWLWGTVFIDRGAKSAQNALTQQAKAIGEGKKKILIFPEGTRNSSDTMLPLRKGAFHVAIDAQAPIQPVVASKYHFLDHKRYNFGSGEMLISILPEIPTAGLGKDDIDDLVAKTQKIMQEEFTKLSAETLERRKAKEKDE